MNDPGPAMRYLCGICTLGIALALSSPAGATLIDFEDSDFTSATSGSNLATTDFGSGAGIYQGLDWTRPNDLLHWRIENDGTPFSGSGGSSGWLLGFADEISSGSPDFAKITQNAGDVFEFLSFDLRTRESKPEFLSEVTVRARDVDNNEISTLIALDDTWTTHTASSLGFVGLGPLKSLTFFGTSMSCASGENCDRFALDNLSINFTAVAAPATLFLMGIGLAAIGVTAKQRTRRT